MPRLTVFENVSLDGYFVDGKDDMSWAHQHAKDKEWDDFVASNASGGGRLIFGRITYEMMASFWPTPFAAQQFPTVAAGMNAMPKFVFSTTLRNAAWSNTVVLKGGLIEEIEGLKSDGGDDLCILGSGSLVPPLANAGLIDEFQLVVNPVVLGRGRSIFDSTAGPLRLRRQQTRAFDNGNVLLTYIRAEM